VTSGMRHQRAPRSGMRHRRAPGPGSRMASGDGAAVSGVTEERERLVVSKNCQVLRERERERERAWGLKF
jgi:hypothetical protein